MKPRAIYFCALHVVLCAGGFSQQLPYISSVTLNVNVSAENNSYYFYRYKLINNSSSVGRIIRFEIDISRPQYSLDLDTNGLRFQNDFVESSFRRHFPSLRGRIVPVGFPQAPGIWDGGLTNALTADFSGDSRMLISPTDSLEGFVLMSKGVPTVRRFIVSPRFDIVSLYPDVEQVNNPDSLTGVINHDREAIKFRGFTVGPTAPPANLIPIAFLDTLTSYKHQASALGWIDSVGVVNSLDQKLANARRLIERGNINAARNILNAFINEVEAQNGHHLTSEAYALLKFNAEYLRDHL